MNLKEIDRKIAHLQSIKKKNELFKKLTPAQRRVEVAKDALKQVQSGIWKAQRMSYVVFDTDQNLTQTCSFENTECQVCARGALFLGAVNKFNNYDPEQEINYPDEVQEMNNHHFGDVEDRLWSKSQIQMIECVFESGDVGTCPKISDYKCVDIWSEKYPNLQDRLVAILKNIIRNKGTFKINDPKDVGKHER